MAFKLCDSCKTQSAQLFCRSASAFLCLSCDSNGRPPTAEARVAAPLICDVCEQAPAQVTCKADAAALCLACDHDIHSVNPVASRHERLPILPLFHEPLNSFSSFDDVNRDVNEAEADPWNLHVRPTQNMLSDHGKDLYAGGMESYLDLDYGYMDPKLDVLEQACKEADGVVPALNEQFSQNINLPAAKPVISPYFTHSTLQHRITSSPTDVGIVPDGVMMAETARMRNPDTEPSNQRSVRYNAADREARVLRYKEKRKNRKFEKTIRYASRKAYAETRPRTKGRFAKRPEKETDHGSGFGIVPSL